MPCATPIKKLRDTLTVEEETIRTVPTAPANDSDSENDVYFTEGSRVLKELLSPKAAKRENLQRLEERIKQREQKHIKPLKFVSLEKRLKQPSSSSPSGLKREASKANLQRDWDVMMERRRTLGSERKKEERRTGENACKGFMSRSPSQRREEGFGSAHVYRAHLMGSP
jgi:hypothetical protein